MRLFAWIAWGGLVLISDAGAWGDDELSTLSIDQMPPPPSEVASLLEAGRVTFHYGDGWKPSSAIGSETSLAETRRMAAETKFQLEYRYSSRTRWHLRRQGSERRLLIDVKFESVELDSSHQVWFRVRPPLSGFWQDRLVQHELDHVRISSNPLVIKQFLGRVDEIRTLSERLEDTVEVTDEMVDQIVARHVKKAFDQSVAAVRIRYQELDRVTDHGMVALPLGGLGQSPPHGTVCGG